MKNIKFLAVLLFVAGCKPSLVPVTGRLTKGAEPIVGVMVSLSPVDPVAGNTVAHGGTDQSGNFTLYTLPRKGVTPGEFGIFLQPTPDGAAAKQIPSKFTDITKSPWKVTIPSGFSTELKLDVNKDTVDH